MHAMGVGRIEGVGDVDGQRNQSLRVHRAARDTMLQGQPIQKLHGDEGLAILLADVVNRTNIGMVECGGGLRFSLKTG